MIMSWYVSIQYKFDYHDNGSPCELDGAYFVDIVHWIQSWLDGRTTNPVRFFFSQN